MDNQTDVSIKFKNYVTGEKKLETYAQTLSTIKSVLTGIDSGATKQIESSAKSTSDISKDVKTISNYTKLAFNYSTVREFSRSLSRVFQEMSRLVTKSSEYLENINLFQVAFDNNYVEADRFINKLTEMYGLDESWLTRTVGIFKQLSNAMNLSSEAGTNLSTLLTQMSIDISSLYNVDIERASSTLQSALAGQTKPIRGTTGADITQNTLQQTLSELGINRYIGDLSYAEKRLIIVISLTRQLSEATNDFGRTIESPANQMRILSEQWERLSRAIGNLFMPVLSSILPYLNAILMVLTEIINVIAGLLGFDIGEYDYFGGVADSVLDLEENLEGATESANKLKRGLRGFDKLNVITTPTSASSGSGAGTGIDPDIMDAFNDAFDEYNSKLEDVQMKAVKIRDAIMEWLGFTKEINPITGDVSFKYEGIETTLKNMWEWFTKLNPKAKILVGLIAGLVTKSVITLLSKFVSLLGKTGLFKWITSLVTPMTQIVKQIREYVRYSPTLSSGIKTAINDWQVQLGVMDKIKNTISGIIMISGGLMIIKTSMDDINDSGLNLLNTLGLVGGSLSTVIGSIQIGASLGGSTGAIIGGIAGSLSVLITAMMEYEDANDKMIESAKESYEAHKSYNDELRKQKDAIEEAMNNSLVQTTYHENLVNELKQIVDETGKVNKGYEDRANFIVTTLNDAYGTEMSIINGTIKGYEEQIKTIQDLIETRKTNILLEANEEAYALAVQEQANAWKRAQKSLSEYNKSNEEANKLLDKMEEAEKLLGTQQFKNFEYIDQQGNKYKGYNAYQKLKDDLKAYEEVVKSNWDTYQEDLALYREYTNDIVRYEQLSTAIITGDKEKIKQAIEAYTNTVIIEGEKQKMSQSELLKFYKQNGDETIAYLESQGVKITEEMKKTAYANYQTTLNSLKEQTTTVEELTPEIVEAWATLAEQSESDFLDAFDDLPDDIQTEVIDKMYDKGYSLSEELQKGISKINPTFKVETDLTDADKTITIDADTTKAREKTQSLWDKLREAFNTTFFTSFGSIPFFSFAQGGLPPVGQLFVANEKGPELVGQIGGQSFVANQEQMMELLDNKIGEAKSTGNTTFIIQVGNEEVAKVVLNELDEISKSNGKPITIGG